MSTHRIVLLLLCSSVAFGQMPGDATFTLTGEIRCDNSIRYGSLFVELYNERDHRVMGRAEVRGDGTFQLDGVVPGAFDVRVTADGENPVFEQYLRIDRTSSPLALLLPTRAASQPVNGTVSVQQLAHPVPKKAYKAFVEAQRYQDPQDTPRAIAKLEEATRIDPDFRDAHINLGARYARTGRNAEALAEFQRALRIGPPNALVYTGLAWASLSLALNEEAEGYARKALALSPKDAKAHVVLGCALSGQPGRETEALDHLQFASREHPEVLPLMAKIRRHMGAAAGAP